MLFLFRELKYPFNARNILQTKFLNIFCIYHNSTLRHWTWDRRIKPTRSYSKQLKSFLIVSSSICLFLLCGLRGNTSECDCVTVEAHCCAMLLQQYGHVLLVWVLWSNILVILTSVMEVRANNAWIMCWIYNPLLLINCLTMTPWCRNM